MAKKSSFDNKKKRLINEIEAAKNEASKCVEKGQKVVKNSQFIKDLTDPAIRFLKAVPDDSSIPPDKWDKQIDIWSNVKSDMRDFNQDLDDTSFQVLSDTTSLSASGFVKLDIFMTAVPNENKIELKEAVRQFDLVINRVNWEEVVQVEVVRLGLNIRRSPGRSVLELLDEAKEAFSKPSAHEANPSAVLISVREAINKALADLLLRRPRQEPAKGISGKIMSLANQCLHPNIKQDPLKILVDNAESIINELSLAKQAKMTRDEIGKTYTRALQFLKALLEVIDESKLK